MIKLLVARMRLVIIRSMISVVLVYQASSVLTPSETMDSRGKRLEILEATTTIVPSLYKVPDSQGNEVLETLDCYRRTECAGQHLHRFHPHSTMWITSDSVMPHILAYEMSQLVYRCRYQLERIFDSIEL